MPNFNPITDLRPVDQDRPSEISSQELQTIKVNLMETTMKTKQIVDVLIRHNSLLERDIEKIADLKRRLRDTNPTIPSLPGWAGFLLGAGVDLGGVPPLLPLGGRKFMPPGKAVKVSKVPAKVKSLKALKAKVSVKALKSKSVNLLNAVKIKAALPESKLQKVITSTNKSKVLELTEATVDKKVLKGKASKALTSGINDVHNKTNKILKSNTASSINSGIKSVTPKSSVKGLLTGSDTTGSNINKNIKKVDLSKINSNKVFPTDRNTRVTNNAGDYLTKQERIKYFKGQNIDLKGKVKSGSTRNFANAVKNIKIQPGSMAKGLLVGIALDQLFQWAIYGPMDRLLVDSFIRIHGYDWTYNHFATQLEEQLAKKDHGGWMTAGNILTLGAVGDIGKSFGFKDYDKMRDLIGYLKYLTDDEERLRKMSKNNGHVSINPAGELKSNKIASASSVPFNTDSLNLNTRKRDVVVILTDSIA